MKRKLRKLVEGVTNYIKKRYPFLEESYQKEVFEEFVYQSLLSELERPEVDDLLKSHLDKLKKAPKLFAMKTGNDSTDAYNQAVATTITNQDILTSDIFRKAPEIYFHSMEDSFKNKEFPRILRHKQLEPLKKRLVKDAKYNLEDPVSKRLFGTSKPIPKWAAGYRDVEKEPLWKRDLFGYHTDKKTKDKYMNTLVNDMRREIDGEYVDPYSVPNEPLKPTKVGSKIIPGIGTVLGSIFNRKLQFEDFLDKKFKDENGKEKYIPIRKMTPEDRELYYDAVDEYNNYKKRQKLLGKGY